MYMYTQLQELNKNAFIFHELLQEIINHLRLHSHSATYGTSMSGPVALQILTCLKIIVGHDGTDDGAACNTLITVS